MRTREKLRTLLTSLLLVAGMLIAGARATQADDWPMFNRDLANTAVAEPALSGIASPTQMWGYTTDNSIGPGSPVIGNIDDDNEQEVLVPTAGFSGNPGIYALDSDGDQIWKYQTGGYGTYATPSLVNLDADGKSEVISVGLTDKVFALDDDGSELWSVSYGTGSFSGTRGTVADISSESGLEVVAGAAGKAYLLKASDGTELWNASYSVLCDPAIADVDDDGELEILFGAGGTSAVVALNAEDGSTAWTSATAGQDFQGTVAIISDINDDGNLDVVAGSRDKKLYVFSGADGSKLWEYSVIGRCFSAAAADLNADGYDDVVTTATKGDGVESYVYALDAKNQTLLWEHNVIGKNAHTTARGPALADVNEDGTLDVVVDNGNKVLYALNGSDGSEIWTVTRTSGGWDASSPAIGDLDGDGAMEIVVAAGDIAQVFAQSPSEVWVDDDYCASCANDGHSWGYDAFDTIQAGIDAVSGSTVHVGPGTYNENVLIPSSKAGLQLLGAGKTQTHLSISSGSAIETHAPVTIKGFHIQGPARGTGTAVQIRSDGSGCPSSASGTALSPGLIEDNKADSLNYGVQLHDHCNEYWEIKNNEFDNLRIPVGLQNSRHFVVSGNTFDDYKEGVSMGWGNDTAFDIAITNNQFLKDGDAGDDLAAIVLSSATHDVTVRGNDINNSDIGVLVKNRDGNNTPDLSNTVVSCNNISGNTEGIVNEHAGATLMAEDNWWGSENGPEDSAGSKEVPEDYSCGEATVAEMKNNLPSGSLGDPVSDDVDYCPWLGASARTVSIDAPDEVGENVTDLVIPVNINCVCDFDAAQFDITYDPSVLEIIGTEGGSAGVTDGDIGGTPIPVSLWGFTPGGTPGTARVIVNVPDAPGVSGSGYLAKIHFKVVGSECTNSDITLSNGLLSDKDAHEIPASWVGDSFHVNAALDADFSVDSGISGYPQEGYAGQTSFQFSDSSTGGTPCGTPPYSYEWDFDNDGTVDSSAQNPTHTYGSAGTYTVKLTVTDCLPGGGMTDTETKTDHITVYPPLDPGCSVSPSEGTTNCTAFTFDDASSGGKAGYTYEWTFGDGTSGSGAPTTHVYGASPACGGSYPTYTVNLKVTDGLGTEKSTTCTVDVYKQGDANKDCSVNIMDVTKVERIILELDTETPGADANCDDSVNVLDVTKIELIIMAAP